MNIVHLPCRPTVQACICGVELFQVCSISAWLSRVLRQSAEWSGMMKTSWEFTIQNTSTNSRLLKVPKSSQVASNKSEFLASFAIFYCALIVLNEA